MVRATARAQRGAAGAPAGPSRPRDERAPGGAGLAGGLPERRLLLAPAPVRSGVDDRRPRLPPPSRASPRRERRKPRVREASGGGRYPDPAGPTSNTARGSHIGPPGATPHGPSRATGTNPAYRSVLVAAAQRHARARGGAGVGPSDWTDELEFPVAAWIVGSSVLGTSRHAGRAARIRAWSHPSAGAPTRGRGPSRTAQTSSICLRCSSRTRG